MEDSCRTCLRTEQSRSLFEYCPKEGLHLHEMIMAFCSVCIKVEDGLSKSICLQCFDDIRRAYAFKNRCEEVDKMLMENLNDTNTSQNDANNIFNNLENYPCVSDFIKEEIDIDFIENLLKCDNLENNIVESKREDSKYDLDKNVSSDNTVSSSPVTVNNNIKSKPKTKNKKLSKSIVKRKIRKQCDPKSTDSKTQLKNKPYSCSSCDYRCEFPSILKKHMWKHTKEKLVLCDQCDYTCGSLSSLNLHKSKHSAERQFVCNDCGFTFKRKHALECHIIRHMGIKEFACSQCSYKSHTQKALRNHMQMVHTGERPFACDQCPYKTTCMEYLKAHKRVHLTYKRFSCDQCSYMTNLKAHLTIHKRTHSGEKPYSCDSCSFKTATTNSLKNHKRGQHGK